MSNSWAGPLVPKIEAWGVAPANGSREILWVVDKGLCSSVVISWVLLKYGQKNVLVGTGCLASFKGGSYSSSQDCRPGEALWAGRVWREGEVLSGPCRGKPEAPMETPPILSWKTKPKIKIYKIITPIFPFPNTSYNDPKIPQSISLYRKATIILFVVFKYFTFVLVILWNSQLFSPSSRTIHVLVWKFYITSEYR